MNKILKNHKYQASILSVFCFLPLIFILFYTQNFLKLNHTPKENNFNLAMKHFINSPQTMQNNTIQKQNFIKKETKKSPIKQENKTFKETTKSLAQQKTTISKPIQKPTQKLEQKPTQNNAFQSVDFKQNDSLLKEIKNAIDDAKHYPRKARKMRMQGEVLVEFIWSKDKELKNLKIIQGSKYEILNKGAIKTIEIASKNFPRYEKDYRIRIPIVYQLN